MRLGLIFSLVAALAAVAAGCYVTPRGRVIVPAPVAVAPVVVAQPPPPVRVEEVPPAPAGPFVWQPGHWRWNGAAYVWHPGHYERRPAERAAWVPAEWVARDGQWVFRPGHWAYP